METNFQSFFLNKDEHMKIQKQKIKLDVEHSSKVQCEHPSKDQASTICII